MSNITACPNCGAPFSGGSVEGEYRCKFCGNVILLKKDGLPTSDSSLRSYQPDPPQNLSDSEETAQTADQPVQGVPNPIPQEVISKLNETRTVLGKVSKYVLWLVIGFGALCVICTTIVLLIFRVWK